MLETYTWPILVDGANADLHDAVERLDFHRLRRDLAGVRVGEQPRVGPPLVGRARAHRQRHRRARLGVALEAKPGEQLRHRAVHLRLPGAGPGDAQLHDPAADLDEGGAARHAVAEAGIVGAEGDVFAPPGVGDPRAERPEIRRPLHRDDAVGHPGGEAGMRQARIIDVDGGEDLPVVGPILQPGVDPLAVTAELDLLAQLHAADPPGKGDLGGGVRQPPVGARPQARLRRLALRQRRRRRERDQEHKVGNASENRRQPLLHG